MFIAFLLNQCAFHFKHPPKREFRGVWIATVANIDWPISYSDSVAKQKADLIDLLDSLSHANINAIIFQVRPECDALYASRYEPWSFWLTGQQGKAPCPYYDPLKFVIKEAHKRGMELHAWFNPFRAERKIGLYPLAQNHVVNRHPEWVLSFGDTNSGLRILNPGLPQVRKYIVNVVMDVVNRYDIDGVHFDDYFYPYPPNEIFKSNKDSLTFIHYKHGDESDADINSWRRENINRLISLLYDSIQTVKPWVKFGVSPFGIYRNNVPKGIKGMDAYARIYCDPLAWLRQGSVDYLVPQLYWKIGGSQDFKKLSDWWGEQGKKYHRHIYAGHIFGRTFLPNELGNQLLLVRENANAYGDVYFSAKHFPANTLGFAQRVKQDFYRLPALTPSMGWKDNEIPTAPALFGFASKDSGNAARFFWRVTPKAKKDSTIRFVIYSFKEKPKNSKTPERSEFIYAIVGGSEYLPAPFKGMPNKPKYFAVTAVNRMGSESPLSRIISIEPPKVTSLLMPRNGFVTCEDTLILQWQWQSNASGYRLQVAEDPDFIKIYLEKTNLRAASCVLTGLKGPKKYYWRVAAENPAGISKYSKVFSFKKLECSQTRDGNE